MRSPVCGAGPDQERDAIEVMAVPRGISGTEGTNCALRERNQTGATNDPGAIRAWLALHEGAPHIWRAYRTQAERILLWAVLERRKPLSSLDAADITAYRGFLTHVPEGWIGERRAARWSKNWRPFAGSLSPSSRASVAAILKSMFQWLTDMRFLDFNARTGVKVSSGEYEATKIEAHHALTLAHCDLLFDHEVIMNNDPFQQAMNARYAVVDTLFKEMAVDSAHAKRAVSANLCLFSESLPGSNIPASNFKCYVGGYRQLFSALDVSIASPLSLEIWRQFAFRVGLVQQGEISELSEADEAEILWRATRECELVVIRALAQSRRVMAQRGTKGHVTEKVFQAGQKWRTRKANLVEITFIDKDEAFYPIVTRDLGRTFRLDNREYDGQKSGTDLISPMLHDPLLFAELSDVEDMPGASIPEVTLVDSAAREFIDNLTHAIFIRTLGRVSKDDAAKFGRAGVAMRDELLEPKVWNLT